MIKLDQQVCPICGTETVFDEEDDEMVCRNGCISFYLTEYHGKIFGVIVNFDKEDISLQFPEDAKYYKIPRDFFKLCKRIEYWRENDRYLLEIMS